MIWLYFDSQADANTAMATIDSRLGLPDSNGTNTWAIAVECVNSKWAFIKPTCDLTGLPTHTEKEHDKVTDLGLGNEPSDAEN